MDKTFPIALICDNDYALPTAVAIASLRHNKAPETRYVVHVVTPDLDETHEERLKQLAGDGLEIRMVRAGIEKYRGLHQDAPQAIRVASTAALLKFDLPQLLPDVDKVLYLDGDLIVRADLSELFATDLDGVYAAVVSDTGQLYFRHETVRKVRNYFNSGVMLMNLKRCREHGMAEVLFEAKKRMSQTNLMDQNVFNVVWEGQVAYLPIVYNFLYLNLLRARGKYAFNDLNRLFGTAYSSLEQILAEAKIVHYSSKDKPWKYSDAPLADEWDRYYRATPWGAEPLVRERMNGAVAERRTGSGKGPSVSIIIPVYNVEPYLRECLESVVRQTRKDIEIICVNDGSTDGSGAILKEYADKDERMAVLEQENAGQSSARNLGMQSARGEYLYFMDSDDTLERAAMEVLYEEATRNQLDVLYFDGDAFFEGKGLESTHGHYAAYYQRRREYNEVIPGPLLFAAMKANWDYKVSPCLQFIRRGYLEDIRLEYYDGIVQEDNLFTFCCLLQARRAQHIGRTLFHRRVRAQSTMTSGAGYRNFEGFAICFVEMVRFARERKDPGVVRAAIVRELKGIYANMAKMFAELPEPVRGNAEGLLLRLRMFDQVLPDFLRLAVRDEMEGDGTGASERLEQMQTKYEIKAWRLQTRLDALVLKTDRDIYRRERKIHGLQEQVQRKREAVDKLKRKLAQIQRSLSWRITAPLRALAGRIGAKGDRPQERA